MIWSNTHLCAGDDTVVTMQAADGKVFVRFGDEERHTLTISGKPEHVTTLLLKAAAQVIEHGDSIEVAS